MSGMAQAFPGAGHVQIDTAFFTNNYYVSTTGVAVKDTFVSGLAHEIGHAVTGLIDNESYAKLSGDNVSKVNDWYAQLGFSPQSSYEAYDVGPNVLKPGFSYTQGNAIKAAIIDKGAYTSTDGSLSFDSGNIDLTAVNVTGPALLVGSDADNNYTGTASGDWLTAARGRTR